MDEPSDVVRADPRSRRITLAAVAASALAGAALVVACQWYVGHLREMAQTLFGPIKPFTRQEWE